MSAFTGPSENLKHVLGQRAAGPPRERPTDLPFRTDGPVCQSCGSANRLIARFCQHCGRPILQAAAPRSHTPLLQTAAHTERGRVRHDNQDMISSGLLPLPDETMATLSLVADGMGGHAAGALASQIAIRAACEYLWETVGAHAPTSDDDWRALLTGACDAANERVCAEQCRDVARQDMGTTLTIAVVAGDRLYIAYVGDTRAYLIGADGTPATQLTTDHTLPERLITIGVLTPEEAASHPLRHTLYRWIGQQGHGPADTLVRPLKPGDTVLLCSDGLTNYVNNIELAEIIRTEPDAQQACDRLAALANARGGEDNISVAIICI